MNARLIGQLAGMQKSALNIKSLRRLFTALAKERPQIFTGSKAEAAKSLANRFSRATWWKGVDPYTAVDYLRTLAPAMQSGRPVTGWKTHKALDQLKKTLGITVDRAARRKSLLPRASKLPPKALKHNQPIGKGVAFRGTNIERELGMPSLKAPHVSGDTLTARGYAAGGGSGYTGSDRGKLLLKYRTAPLQFRQHLPTNPAVLRYEAQLPNADARRKHISKAWRAFTTWDHDISPDALRRVYGVRKRPKGTMFTRPAEFLTSTDAQFVPISKPSLAKWIANLSSESVPDIHKLIKDIR